MHSRLIRLILVALIMALSCAGVFTAPKFFTPRDREYLVYKIYLAGVALGEEKLEIEHKILDGKPVVVINQTLDSYRVVLNLVDYHEKRTIVWDPEAACPLFDEAVITDHKKTSQNKVAFLADGTAAIDHIAPDGTASSQLLKCTPGTQTGGSLLYFLRTFPWERGETRLPLLGSLGTDWYDFQVKAESRSFTVPFGRFHATYHLVNAALKYDIWFDQGPGRLPLEIKSRSGFGVAQARLVEAWNYQ